MTYDTSGYMAEAHSRIEELARDELLECRPRFLEWVSENAQTVGAALVAAYCGTFSNDPTGRRRNLLDRRAIAMGALAHVMSDYQAYRLEDAASSEELADLAREIRDGIEGCMREEA